MSRSKAVKKILFVLYLTLIHITLGGLVFDRYFTANNAKNDDVRQVIPLLAPMQIPDEDGSFAPNSQITNQTVGNSNSSNTNTNPTPFPTLQNTNQDQNRQTSVVISSEKLMIPVVGIKREKLSDTYNDARSDNRIHNAIDIMAPQGTPVVAVADGEIARFFDSKLGGITIYQFSKDRKFIYYYAHLQNRAENLQEKVSVPQGTVIGYVGDTGNAGTGNYHLHFSIIVPTDPQRYWEGENINPYPILKEGIEPRIR